jgi:hypothetical protein
MTQIIEWLNQHNINVAAAIGTVAILVVASTIILVLGRLVRQWLTYLQGRLHLTYETRVPPLYPFPACAGGGAGAVRCPLALAMRRT